MYSNCDLVFEKADDYDESKVMRKETESKEVKEDEDEYEEDSITIKKASEQKRVKAEAEIEENTLKGSRTGLRKGAFQKYH